MMTLASNESSDGLSASHGYSVLARLFCFIRLKFISNIFKVGDFLIIFSLLF